VTVQIVTFVLDAVALAAPAGHTVQTAHDSGFDGPDTLAAGTANVTMDNLGTIDHMLFIARLEKNQDRTAEQ